MRQLIVRVPQGKGQQVIAAARAHDGVNIAAIAATCGDGPVDLVFAHVANAKVEPLLGCLSKLEQLHVTLIPRGVITIEPPSHKASEQAIDVAPRSPLEIFVGGLQSVGSWTGLLGYAVASGAVVWIGLTTNRSFLLVAAMLIAPFAGPAMNAAVATARGDARLLGRALARYSASLAAAIFVALLLSMMLGQRVVTRTMEDASFLSSTAVLLPLVAGAAGALSLCQSERASLVSGAATGVLVAASLAPPAGLVGMAIALGEWTLLQPAMFVLLLQIAGINLAGAIVFRLYGLGPRGVRYDRGRPWIAASTWFSSLLAVAALTTWQLSSTPELRQASEAQRATFEVRQVVEASGLARLVEADVRFSREHIPNQRTLLAKVHVMTNASDPDAIERRLADRIGTRLTERFEATPLVDVTVLMPPPSHHR